MSVIFENCTLKNAIKDHSLRLRGNFELLTNNKDSQEKTLDDTMFSYCSCPTLANQQITKIQQFQTKQVTKFQIKVPLNLNRFEQYQKISQKQRQYFLLMNKYTVVKVHLEEANRKILKCENVHLHALLLEQLKNMFGEMREMMIGKKISIGRQRYEYFQRKRQMNITVMEEIVSNFIKQINNLGNFWLPKFMGKKMSQNQIERFERAFTTQRNAIQLKHEDMLKFLKNQEYEQFSGKIQIQYKILRNKYDSLTKAIKIAKGEKKKK